MSSPLTKSRAVNQSSTFRLLSCIKPSACAIASSNKHDPQFAWADRSLSVRAERRAPFLSSATSSSSGGTTEITSSRSVMSIFTALPSEQGRRLGTRHVRTADRMCFPGVSNFTEYARHTWRYVTCIVFEHRRRWRRRSSRRWRRRSARAATGSQRNTGCVPDRRE